MTYADAIASADIKTVDGVAIPFASPATPWRMKQTVREKDEADRIFLRRLLTASSSAIPNLPSDSTAEATVWQRFWRKLTGR